MSALSTAAAAAPHVAAFAPVTIAHHLFPLPTVLTVCVLVVGLLLLLKYSSLRLWHVFLVFVAVLAVVITIPGAAKFFGHDAPAAPAQINSQIGH